MDSPRYLLARELADQFAALPGIIAISLGGSTTGGLDDDHSDIDLDCFVESEPPVAARRAIIASRARTLEIDNRFFGTGDEWIEAASGCAIDLAYFQRQWIADELERVLVRHIPALGYTTCFWYTIQHALSLHDPNGWLAALQEQARQPYPEPLRQAIIAHNRPVLRQNQSSYLHQIALAIARDDPVSVNHRVTALLASYFEIVFAVNRLPQPGEKRLIAYVQYHCASLPAAMDTDLTAMIAAIAAPREQNLIRIIERILDRLDAWLRIERNLE